MFSFKALEKLANIACQTLLFVSVSFAMDVAKARCYLDENNDVWLAMLASFARP